jgi:hypothetical protein
MQTNNEQTPPVATPGPDVAFVACIEGGMLET